MSAPVPSRSRSSSARPIRIEPSMSATVAGTAPPARTMSSRARAVSTFSGWGMPWDTIVDSRATTGRPPARASATSSVGHRGGSTGSSWRVGRRPDTAGGRRIRSTCESGTTESVANRQNSDEIPCTPPTPARDCPACGAPTCASWTSPARPQPWATPTAPPTATRSAPTPTSGSGWPAPAAGAATRSTGTASSPSQRPASPPTRPTRRSSTRRCAAWPRGRASPSPRRSSWAASPTSSTPSGPTSAVTTPPPWSRTTAPPFSFPAAAPTAPACVPRPGTCTTPPPSTSSCSGCVPTTAPPPSSSAPSAASARSA